MLEIESLTINAVGNNLRETLGANMQNLSARYAHKHYLLRWKSSIFGNGDENAELKIYNSREDRYIDLVSSGLVNQLGGKVEKKYEVADFIVGRFNN